MSVSTSHWAEQGTMSSFDELELAELREAFNEFDKVPSMISRPSCLHEVHRVVTVLC